MRVLNVFSGKGGGRNFDLNQSLAAPKVKTDSVQPHWTNSIATHDWLAQNSGCDPAHCSRAQPRPVLLRPRASVGGLPFTHLFQVVTGFLINPCQKVSLKKTLLATESEGMTLCRYFYKFRDFQYPKSLWKFTSHICKSTTRIL